MNSFCNVNHHYLELQCFLWYVNLRKMELKTVKKSGGRGIKKKIFLEATFFVCFLHDLHGRFKDYLMIKRNTEITLIRRVDVFL